GCARCTGGARTRLRATAGTRIQNRRDRRLRSLRRRVLAGRRQGVQSRRQARERLRRSGRAAGDPPDGRRRARRRAHEATLAQARLVSSGDRVRAVVRRSSLARSGPRLLPERRALAREDLPERRVPARAAGPADLRSGGAPRSPPWDGWGPARAHRALAVAPGRRRQTLRAAARASRVSGPHVLL